MKIGKTAAVFFFLFIFISVHPLFSDNGKELLLQWFDSLSNARRYGKIQEELLGLFQEAESGGIPGELLLVKLKEGAAKNIPSERLLVALKQEKKRYQSALDIIEAAGYSSEVPARLLEQPVKTLGILLREGLAPPFLENLLSRAHEERLELTDGIAACSTVFQVKKITNLPEAELLRLGYALYKSSLPPSGYDALASVFLKAKVQRLSDRDTLEIVLRIFENGGSLIQLEREINRRVRR